MSQEDNTCLAHSQRLDSGGWECLRSNRNEFFLTADQHIETSRTMRVDFLAEGVQRNLKELDEPLRQHFEEATGEPVGSGRTGQTRYFKKISGYTNSLPESGAASFWTADAKHLDVLVPWTKKSGGKSVPTAGTKATGQDMRTNWT